jgi:hypothetical protein
MSFRRRRLLVLAVLGAAVALAGGAWLLWPRPAITTAITLENAAKIQQGMTLAEVEAILGGPPRNETEAVGIVVNFPEGFGGFEPGALLWNSDTTICAVLFDRNGRVISHNAFAAHPYESTFDRLRRWLGL